MTVWIQTRVRASFEMSDLRGLTLRKAQWLAQCLDVPISVLGYGTRELHFTLNLTSEAASPAHDCSSAKDCGQAARVSLTSRC